MPINKFGSPLERVGARTHDTAVASLRSYVRNNALCLRQSDDDARERKIRRVVAPETDTDATNKRYVETTIQDVRSKYDLILANNKNLIKEISNRVDHQAELLEEEAAFQNMN